MSAVWLSVWAMNRTGIQASGTRKRRRTTSGRASGPVSGHGQREAAVQSRCDVVGVALQPRGEGQQLVGGGGQATGAGAQQQPAQDGRRAAPQATRGRDHARHLDPPRGVAARRPAGRPQPFPEGADHQAVGPGALGLRAPPRHGRSARSRAGSPGAAPPAASGSVRRRTRRSRSPGWRCWPGRRRWQWAWPRAECIGQASRATSACRKQVTAWSLTSPADCMKAYTMVGPTNEKPRFFRSRGQGARGIGLVGHVATRPSVLDWSPVHERPQVAVEAAQLVDHGQGGARVADGRADLGAVANDPRVGQEPRLVVRPECGDGTDVEAGERASGSPHAGRGWSTS